MVDSESVSGFESDAGDVAAVDWTLPREAEVAAAEEQAAPAARPAGTADAADAADADDTAPATTTTTSSGDWLEEASSDDDDDDDEEEDEDEDDESEEEEESEEAAGTSADEAAAEEEEDRPPTPTHARLLRLAYTVGSRLASTAVAAAATTAGATAAGAAAAAAAAAAAGGLPAEQGEGGEELQPQQAPRPARRPLECAIAPLPVPPKPPHAPLLQRLNAAVAGDLVPRGGAGAAALLDRRGAFGGGGVGGSGGGAPLSSCRRALARASGGAAGGGGGSSDDDDDDVMEDTEDDDDDDGDADRQPTATTTTPQRRSARLAAAALGGDDDEDDDAAGARDQEEEDDDRRQPQRRPGGATTTAANTNKRSRPTNASPSPFPSLTTTLTVLNTARLLLKRDLGLGAGAGGSLSRAQRLHAVALPPNRALPTVPVRVRDQMASRAYVGQFSSDGALFVAAFQDRRVRLYDVGAPSGGLDAGGDGDRVRGNSSGNGGSEEQARGPAASSSSDGGGRCFFTRWRLRKDISTRLTRWTVTDTALSPDGRYLVYSSITPVVWLVDVGAAYDPSRVDSRANETQLHDALSFAGPPPPDAPPAGQGGDGDDGRFHHHHHHHQRNFGVWSVAWAPGASGELVAGTSDRSALVYDMGAGRPVARMGGHGDDVNAVAHLDPLSPFLVVTGSDDALVRLWDRRVGGGGGGNGGVASARRAAAAEGGGAAAGGPGSGSGNNTNTHNHQLSQTSTPVGVWVGHTEGLTHLSPRGDGRLLLSNAKDQTARVWDARSGLRPPSEARALPAVRGGRGSGYDYRWEAFPYRGHDVRHPHDASVQVYRGHSVLQSLVRAYWSPEESTGGRYVYAGSADGAAVVWDAATAEVVARLSGAHGAVVRDVAWHPREPAIVTASWDGRLIEWRAPGGG